MLLHTSALRHKHFFHRDDDGAKRNFWTQPRLHTGAFTQRCFLTQVCFHTQYFYTVLLHVSSLTQRFFYPQILLHRDTLALHNDVYLRQAFFHAHTGALTGLFLKRTHFYTEMILHWAALQADTITSRGAFTKEWNIHEELRMFLHRHAFVGFPTAGTHFRATRVQQADVKPQFQRTFGDRDAFRGKGLTQRKPTLQFTFRARGLRFVDALPP